MTSDDNNVVRLEGTEWYSAQELANRLGVSVRTIYRRLERGEVEKRETARGTVYRASAGSENGSSSVSSTDIKSDSKIGEAMLRLVDQTREQSGRIAELSAEVARLESRLEAALEDRQRLIDYVEDSDARLDSVVEELEQAEADLLQTRARVYLEAGRRELAEERLDDERERRRHLEEEKSKLEREIGASQAKSRRWSPFNT